MRATIERLPDGTYKVEVPPEELEEVKRKLQRNDELDDREVEIARMFELL